MILIKDEEHFFDEEKVMLLGKFIERELKIIMTKNKIGDDYIFG
jgi:hypothetical protein